MNTGFGIWDLQPRKKSETQFDAHLLDDLGIKIDNLVTDSRMVKPGDTFLACVGDKFDAREFIPQAIAAGANAVLWERHRGFSWNAAWQVPNLPIAGLRAKAGMIASQVYGQPSQKLWLIGITGTNGKTSCSHWIAQAMTALGRKTAVIGTLGNGFPGALKSTINTTPDAVRLQQEMADFLRHGAGCVAMEVSSHGIEQERINGVTFAVALFTNLSRDHLDYHDSMQEYAAVKARLFLWPGLKYAVLNLDDAFGVELSQRLAAIPTQIIGYGFEELGIGNRDSEKISVLHGSNLKSNIDGLEFDVEFRNERTKFKTEVVGRFNASNLLAVLAALLASGIKLADAVQAVQQVRPIAGRMERLGGGDQPLVVVDYAHTPDALEKVLTTLREVLRNPDNQQKAKTKNSKLVCVFGCGGERDRGKRPLLGKVASRLADEVIITSDNPRSENPRAIIDEIAAAADANYHIEEDRAAAIYRAIHDACQGDVVLIAGKGHEMYQEIGGHRFPFSDSEVARQVLQDLAVQQGTGVRMMAVQEAARALDAEWRGEDAFFTGVSTDSRMVGRGNLFVALRGEKYDGHEFVVIAKERGAVAAMVCRGAETRNRELGIPLILVKDTRLGLGQLAAHWRGRFAIPLVAVTGSNGKTTVKEMIASILRQATGGADRVLATEGNLNNDIGVPQMLLRLRAQHAYAVIEMGMNHAGEIAYLTGLAKPSVALITNAGAAHLEGLGSVEAVARAKGEVFEGLDLTGVAVINADDPYAPLWRKFAGSRRVVDFGLGAGAAVSARYQLNLLNSKMTMTLPDGVEEVTLQVPGEHNVRNALAAAAATAAMGIGKETIALGLSKFSGVKGRMQKKRGLHEATLIDDSYNANPESVRAALAVLAAALGKKILVLGDMGELGANAVALHARIGEEARLAGVDRLFAMGELSTYAVAKFGAGARHFERIEELVAEIRTQLAADVTVLVKGSRFMQMERVVKDIELQVPNC